MPLIHVWVNDLALYSNRDGFFNHTLRLKEGINSIEVKARSKDHRETSIKRIIELDTIPPYVKMESIRPSIDQAGFEILGIIEKNVLIRFLDQEQLSDSSGHFILFIQDTYSGEEISIIFNDAADNRTVKRILLP